MDKKTQRKEEFKELITNNYNHTFITSLEPAVNAVYAKGDITKIVLIPGEIPGVAKSIDIYEGSKKVENKELEDKIKKFIATKKKALEKNSDYYFKQRKSSNQKENLIHRSLGEEVKYFDY